MLGAQTDVKRTRAGFSDLALIQLTTADEGTPRVDPRHGHTLDPNDPRRPTIGWRKTYLGLQERILFEPPLRHCLLSGPEKKRAYIRF